MEIAQKKMKALWVWLCKNKVPHEVEFKGKLIHSITLKGA